MTMTSHFVTIVYKYNRKNLLSQHNDSFSHYIISFTFSFSFMFLFIFSLYFKFIYIAKQKAQEKNNQKKQKDLTNEWPVAIWWRVSETRTFLLINYQWFLQKSNCKTIAKNQVILITNNWCKSKSKTTIPCFNSNWHAIDCNCPLITKFYCKKQKNLLLKTTNNNKETETS